MRRVNRIFPRVELFIETLRTEVIKKCDTNYQLMSYPEKLIKSSES